MAIPTFRRSPKTVNTSSPYGTFFPYRMARETRGRYRGPIHSRGNSNSPTLQATRRDKARTAPPPDLRPPKVVTPLPFPTVTLDFSISVHIQSKVGIKGSIHSSGTVTAPPLPSRGPPPDLRPPKVVTPLPFPTVTLDFSISVHIQSKVGIKGSIHSSGN